MPPLSHFRAATIIPLLLWGTIGSATPPLPKSVATETPSYSCGPITHYSSALPQDSVRFKKGQHYNSQAGPPLTDNSESLLITFPKTHTQRNPIPVSSSDVIAIGTITGGQSFLSSDQGNIYSEFQFAVLQILLAGNQNSMLPGRTIDVQREGGAVRLASGKVLSRCSAGQSMPVAGSRYLLFLKYDQENQTFLINTGYVLQGGHVYNLDDFTSQDDKHALEHPLHQQSLTEPQFIDRIKSAIAAREEVRQ